MFKIYVQENEKCKTCKYYKPVELPLCIQGRVATFEIKCEHRSLCSILEPTLAEKIANKMVDDLYKK